MGYLRDEAQFATGWIPADETWTFGSKDGSTYTFYVSADVTQKYSPGMRIKATQGGTVNYLIVTNSVYSSTTGTVTVFGGTDYSLTGTSISANYYSLYKAPLGFPLNPTKWEVLVTDTQDRSQNTPSANTYYNVGTTNSQITIPIGAWLVSYKICTSVYAAATGSRSLTVTLSTANNSESDTEFSKYNDISGGASYFRNSCYVEKSLVLAAKTLYYLNLKCAESSMGNLTYANSLEKLVIRARCAYL